MTHTEVRRSLSAYLDNAVDPAQRGEIDAHLAGCASCRKALGELERTVGHLRSLPEVEPPPWLHGKIMARVRDEVPPSPFWRRLLFPLHIKLPLEAVVLIFVCVTGYYLARMNSSQLPLSAPESVPRHESPLPVAPPTQGNPAPEAKRPAVPSSESRQVATSRREAPPPPAPASSPSPAPAAPAAESVLPAPAPPLKQAEPVASLERRSEQAARLALEAESARRDGLTLLGSGRPRGGSQAASSAPIAPQRTLPQPPAAGARSPQQATMAEQGAPKEVTATGTIRKQGMTTYMYGTHVLLDDGGKPQYALRSDDVDLDRSVGRKVTVKGYLVHGYPIEAGPPYLSVTAIDATNKK